VIGPSRSTKFSTIGGSARPSPCDNILNEILDDHLHYFLLVANTAVCNDLGVAIQFPKDMTLSPSSLASY
jgi:hypothetical protein